MSPVRERQTGIMSRMRDREARQGHDKAAENQDSKNGQDFLLKRLFDDDFEHLRL